MRVGKPSRSLDGNLNVGGDEMACRKESSALQNLSTPLRPRALSLCVPLAFTVLLRGMNLDVSNVFAPGPH